VQWLCKTVLVDGSSWVSCSWGDNSNNIVCNLSDSSKQLIKAPINLPLLIYVYLLMTAAVHMHAALKIICIYYLVWPSCSRLACTKTYLNVIVRHVLHVPTLKVTGVNNLQDAFKKSLGPEKAAEFYLSFTDSGFQKCPWTQAVKIMSLFNAAQSSWTFNTGFGLCPTVCRDFS